MRLIFVNIFLAWFEFEYSFNPFICNDNFSDTYLTFAIG